MSRLFAEIEANDPMTGDCWAADPDGGLSCVTWVDRDDGHGMRAVAGRAEHPLGLCAYHAKQILPMDLFALVAS